MFRGLWRGRRLGIATALSVCAALPAHAQQPPSPSQVAPPVIAPAPSTPRISLPQVPAGGTIPENAKRLSFVLTGVDIEDEFEEFADRGRQLAQSLIGKRITVADLFDLANKLQQEYVRAGYPLARVVIVPQELEQRARATFRVIDGYIERLDTSALAPRLVPRVTAVLAPLVGKRRLTQDELERKLLIAGETAGLTLNAVFGAGKEVGGSLLVLTGTYRPVFASVYGDNAMPRTFGTGQVVATAGLNSVLGIGEQITVSAAGYPQREYAESFPTRRYLSASMSGPIGIDGLKYEVGVTNGVTTPRVDANAASQGLLNQARLKLIFDIVKKRSFEFSIYGRFDSTDEQVNTLIVTPAVPLSLDRLRVARGGFEGVWRGRETGTTISFGAAYSQGLNVFGARLATDATPLLPLSRQDADAVFQKIDAHFEVTQGLPQDFVASLAASTQYSFNHALLTSEQFGIVGATQLSGFTAGALVGDNGWVIRGELSRPVTIDAVQTTFTPYGFVAFGERSYESPTVLEIGSIHAVNYGGGLRFYPNFLAAIMLNGYGFIEWSRRTATDSRLDGDRIFFGGLLRY